MIRGDRALRLLEEQQNEKSKDEIINAINNFSERPLISIIMPVYNPDLLELEMAIQSIKNQVYTNWQMCIVNDGSDSIIVREYIENCAKDDSRIIFANNEDNRGISYTSNKAISLATGEFIALFDQDDEMTPDALYRVVEVINQNGDVDWIYTDECKISKDGIEKKDFYFKPDWSIALLLSHMYTGHLTVYRKSIVELVGGFREEYNFSQDYDLALRLSEVTDKIVHIERVLYFWRMSENSAAAGGKEDARLSNLNALSDWYKRHEITGHVLNLKYANGYQIERIYNPLVSVIIPSDSVSMLELCIKKLINQTSYSNYEILIVTNNECGKAIKERFIYCNNIIRIIEYNEKYNFSKKCNCGAKAARGEFVVFYNDDVYPYSSDWIEVLLGEMERTNVGGVSPLLIHEDGTIQYAGMYCGGPGFIGTSCNGELFDTPEGATFNHFLKRNITILSGACMMMKMDHFQKLGGFDEINTPNGHSDVSLSFKILDSGLECVYVPTACLIHAGNHSWNEPEKLEKIDLYCIKKWPQYMFRDPFYTRSMMTCYENVLNFEYYMYQAVEQDKNSTKDVLVVMHTLNRTGAPIVMLEWIKLLKKNGIGVFVISMEDGDLRQDIISLGINVIIAGAGYYTNVLFRKFAYNFDLVICNTLATYTAVNSLMKMPIQVIWWLHEAKLAYNTHIDYSHSAISDNIHIYCAGEYACNVAEHFFKRKLYNLNFGLWDESKINSDNIDYKTFVLAGTLETRKGQKVLYEAIKKLPEALKHEYKFIVVGGILENDDSKAVYELSKEMQNSGEIILKNSVPRQELFELYQTMTCLIVPSTDDPGPATAIEAMMLRKPCICSDATGVSCYITDNEDGFVFKSEDAYELAEKIKQVASMSKHDIDEVGKRGRKIYEKYYSHDTFSKEALDVIEKYIL